LAAIDNIVAIESGNVTDRKGSGPTGWCHIQSGLIYEAAIKPKINVLQFTVAVFS